MEEENNPIPIITSAMDDDDDVDEEGDISEGLLFSFNKEAFLSPAGKLAAI